MARVEELDEAEINRRWGFPEYVDAMTHVQSFDRYRAESGGVVRQAPASGRRAAQCAVSASIVVDLEAV